MQLVLDNRPYHFAHWMLILQQWEPTVATSFPSQIPFEIKVQDVPIHLWSEAMLRSIGTDLGIFDSWEITKVHAKMKVQVNGLLPLLKTYNLEFANGDEVLATLVYEKLEKHCVKCGMLDHEESECPDLSPEQVEAKSLPPPPVQRRVLPPSRPSWDTSRTITERQREEPRREESWRKRGRVGTISRTHPYHTSSLQRSRWSNDSRHSNNYRGRDRIASNNPGSYSNMSIRESQRECNPRWVETGRRISTSALADNTSRMRSSELRKEQTRERRSGERRSGEGLTKQNNLNGRSLADSSQSRNSHHSEHQNPHVSDLPATALTEAREEVRDVMSQYANCADPIESAARKERMRLAEERGEFEQTAVQMVRHSLRTQSQFSMQREEEVLEPLMHERDPASQRLGPVLTDIPIEEGTIRLPAKKRLGRPPNKKKVMPSTPQNPKKRRMTQLTGSLKRRLIMGSTSRKTSVRNAPKPSVRNAPKSKGQPPCTIVPAISKQRVDFQDPSSHLP
ncbi:unnamed protein product [Microthlaspi erraticum]|uniref:Zinc knuckle CX2CX4HX4C domain-containing protein n=1 Tax=Microthlaspi erraticum TaxID=1685480 RepID=A0A6D2I1V5_9BRAS|nr:unnamed protein product [Microthlaspi erraticum]